MKVNLCLYMNDPLFLILRCALALTAGWIVWLVIDAFRGGRKEEIPNDDPPGKSEGDSKDK